MTFLENIREALRAIKGNLLRAILTILVIAFGITALIGVHTSIEGVKWWFTHSLSTLGSNTFRIQNVSSSIRRAGSRGKSEYFPPITYHEAVDFKKTFLNGSIVSITANGNFAAVAKYKNKTTNGNIQIIGTDEHYATTANYKIGTGRNISPTDVELLRNVIVIGQEVHKKLFKNLDPLGKEIQISGHNYTVVGTFEEMGSAGRMGGDKICVVPFTTLRKLNGIIGSSYGINVYATDPNLMNDLIVEAVGDFRLIRNLGPRDGNNFGIGKSDQMVQSLMESLSMLTIAAYVIAGITLFSAAIGLMNIMLVSVTDRTKEIGVRKAIGAKYNNVLMQFLTEAIVICQLGGLLGILFGVLIGNGVGSMLGTDFIVPWSWVVGGIALCTVVGLVSGLGPAIKAAKVDPIESLRHE